MRRGQSKTKRTGGFKLLFVGCKSSIDAYLGRHIGLAGYRAGKREGKAGAMKAAGRGS